MTSGWTRCCSWSRSRAPRTTGARVISTWTGRAGFAAGRAAMSRRSYSQASRCCRSGSSATRRKGRSRPISCGTGRSRKAAASAGFIRACGSTSARPSQSERPKRRLRMPDRVAGQPKVYTIPGHRSFADALATGVIRRFGKDALELARGRILVPNNRAVRTVTEAFVRASGDGLLLPRLIPIGDPELDDRIGGALEPIDKGDQIPPAIDPLQRLLALADLVRGDSGSSAEAMRLASDLARTLDALLVEEIDPHRLAEAATDAPDLAAHWQLSLD